MLGKQLGLLFLLVGLSCLLGVVPTYGALEVAADQPVPVLGSGHSLSLGIDNDSPYNMPKQVGFDLDREFSQPVGVTTVGHSLATAHFGTVVFDLGTLPVVSTAFNTWVRYVDGEAGPSGDKPAELVNSWIHQHETVVVRTLCGTNESPAAHVKRHKEYVRIMQEAFPPDQTETGFVPVLQGTVPGMILQFPFPVGVVSSKVA